jgi:predicted dehydrogenase
MGYAYEITGTAGTIKFDQEDQNALWLYRAEGSAAERGFQKILAGPSHPDYLPFCQGPGHGTGYQDQIIIEASHFLNAIHSGKPAWPGFDVGLNVSRIVEAAWQSNDSRGWVPISAIVDAE